MPHLKYSGTPQIWTHFGNVKVLFSFHVSRSIIHRHCIWGSSGRCPYRRGSTVISIIMVFTKFPIYTPKELDTRLYGIDWNAPLGTDDDSAKAVQVSAIHNPLSPDDYSQLCDVVDPTAYSDTHGVDQYIATLQFIVDRVAQY